MLARTEITRGREIRRTRGPQPTMRKSRTHTYKVTCPAARKEALASSKATTQPIRLDTKTQPMSTKTGRARKLLATKMTARTMTRTGNCQMTSLAKCLLEAIANLCTPSISSRLITSNSLLSIHGRRRAALASKTCSRRSITRT